MPLATHMIHPRMSLLTSPDIVVGGVNATALRLTLGEGDRISRWLQSMADGCTGCGKGEAGTVGLRGPRV